MNIKILDRDCTPTVVTYRVKLQYDTNETRLRHDQLIDLLDTGSTKVHSPLGGKVTELGKHEYKVEIYLEKL